MDRVWSRALIVGHALIWVALSFYAFDAATQNKFAACWTLWGSIFYLPVLTIATFSFPYVALWVFRPSGAPKLPFLMACHGVILTSGFASTVFVALRAAGPIGCL